MTKYTFDPTRMPLVVGDPRLTRLFQRDPETCATLDEYARTTGISTEKVLELISPYLDNGTLGLDVVDEAVFVHTAPQGRPTPAVVPEVPPNLWERLRAHGDTARAFELWRLYRALERAGWRVEANPHAIRVGLGPLGFTPPLGIRIQQTVVPVSDQFDLAGLTQPGGLLAAYARAGAPTVAVVCPSGALDAAGTAVRSWFATQQFAGVSVLLLEAPRYTPTLLTPTDGGVRPRSVSELPS